MDQYLNLLRHVLDNGLEKGDRTGTGTRAVFGYTMRFDLKEGFPLVTTKALPFRIIVEELLWFISGSTNIRPLVLANVNIWNEWPFQKWLTVTGQAQNYQKGSDEWKAQLRLFVKKISDDEEFAADWGSIGPGYGKQWRNFGNKVDQLEEVLRGLETDPNSRRLIVTAWNPLELAATLLPPCHTLFQFNVVDGTLSCLLYQRSGDVFLGIPFNIASYALLTHMVAQVTGLVAGEFIHVIADAHLYNNHLEKAQLQLTRAPLPLPKLILDPIVTTLEGFTAENIQLLDYTCHPAIKAEVSV